MLYNALNVVLVLIELLQCKFLSLAKVFALSLKSQELHILRFGKLPKVGSEVIVKGILEFRKALGQLESQFILEFCLQAVVYGVSEFFELSLQILELAGSVLHN